MTLGMRGWRKDWSTIRSNAHGLVAQLKVRDEGRLREASLAEQPGELAYHSGKHFNRGTRGFFRLTARNHLGIWARR
jgi:hypothetical protein